MNLSAISFPKEPAMYVVVINAIILAATTFGLPITNEQKLAVDGLVAPALLLISGFVIRQNVTANANVPSATLTIAQQIDAMRVQRDDINKALAAIAAESVVPPAVP